MSVPNALGLPRVRLAELLYEHEGFVDHEGGFHAPDRHVPVWIEKSLTEPHCGDCTKVPASCMTCHAQMALDQWDEFTEMIARAASVIEARRAAATKIDAVHESAVAESQTPNQRTTP